MILSDFSTGFFLNYASKRNDDNKVIIVSRSGDECGELEIQEEMDKIISWHFESGDKVIEKKFKLRFVHSRGRIVSIYLELE